VSWNDWNKPTEKDLLEVIKKITKYVKFIDPKIIQALTIENNKRITYFKEMLLKHDVDSSQYIWSNSAFTFPGVRRHVGRDEISNYKHKPLSKENTKEKGTIYIDDNDFPKHLWAYIMTGKKFSKKGPSKYQLAHILDHKVYNNRLQEEWKVSEPIKLPGLFTVATNLCYIPSDFIKPTDFNANMRKMLAAKAWQLYKGVANIIPEGLNIDFTQIDKPWHPDSFEWGDAVGNMSNLNSFLEFRETEMQKIISKIK
jgi:hypothetical protein